MSRWWKSYNHYSSIERTGIAVLLILIVIILLVNITMKYWVNNKSASPDPELVAAFQKYKQEHLIAENTPAFSDNEPALIGTLFPFDPNTLDSAGFIRLGLRPKTTHMLLNWRRKGKTFYKKEDLKTLYTLKDEEYTRLEPYIAITSVNSYSSNFTPFEKQAPLPDHIDLNTTDSATLVRLRGIGPTLAHKILVKRNELGGFLKHEQLKEVYNFSDTVYNMLKEKLVINPKTVKKYKLNSATVEELSSHAYINEKMAKNIILFREGLKGFTNIEQLRQVPLMNEEIYRKIAPYFVLE